MKTTKLAKDLIAGDKIELEDRTVVRVIKTERGFLRYEGDTSILITHNGGWSQVSSRREIHLAGGA